MRVVLDTNVLLAAIATHGLCEAVVTLIYREHVVVLSQHILDEVARHHRGKFKATKSQADAAVAVFRSSSEIVVPQAVPRSVLRDKDDLPILGTALAGAASCIVTGDRELLALGRFEGVSIFAPREFYERIRGQGP